MDELTRLAAIEDIKQLKHRYFQGVDTNDWALIDSVFHDDFTGAATDPAARFKAIPDAAPEVLQGREAASAISAV